MSSTDSSSSLNATHLTGVKGIAPQTSINNASSRRIGIVHTQWNTEIIQSLVQGAIGELKRQGLTNEQIHVLSVSIE